VQVALVAAKEAVAMAGLEWDEPLRERTAVVMGTGAGGVISTDDAYRSLYAQGRDRVHPFTISRSMVSAAAGHICTAFGLHGPSFAVSSACASATHAIGEAMWLIRTGRADLALAGGSEACIGNGSVRAWSALRVLALECCRPFSKGRDGMVLGEGAGVLVLEDAERAHARGADVIAVLAGYGASADAGDLALPSEVGIALAMSRAVEDAGVASAAIDYVNAHGTGTLANDATETVAIKRVFGARAAALAVSSTKSTHGHAMGAAGALEAIATLQALRTGIVPPTANYLGFDPACDLDYVPNDARAAEIRGALMNSFAFGGLNAVLCLTASRSRSPSR
jgi:nodulation protein E